MSECARVVYVTDLTFDRFDGSDLFDLAALLRSPEHQLVGVCFAGVNGGGERILDALSLHAPLGGDVPPIEFGSVGLARMLIAAADPINLIVVGAYSIVAEALDGHPELFREKVTRLFIVGGHANDYVGSARRLPIAPRLRERFPERYAPAGDPRLFAADRPAWARLLTCGQAVIFLPRDICLWSYAAPGVLAGGGSTCDFLLRELFWTQLSAARDRYEAAARPVLLSTLPALLLAVKPDPFVWMRLFRVIAARIALGPDQSVREIDTASESPNLYLVTAVDGKALGGVLTRLLRDTPANANVQ